MIVHNNGTFGQTFMQQTNIYGHTYGTTFRAPTSRRLRGPAARRNPRHRPKDVESALRRGLAATKQKPALVEVMVADHPSEICGSSDEGPRSSRGPGIGDDSDDAKECAMKDDTLGA